MRLTAAAAVPLFDIDAVEFDGLDEAVAETLARDIRNSVAELFRPAPAKSREFAADSPAAARIAAAAWLQDFSAHEPLEIDSIRTERRGDNFVAVVTYRSSERVAPDETDEERTPENASAEEVSDAAPLAASLGPAFTASELPTAPALDVPVVRKLPRVALLQVGGSEPR